MVYLLIKKQKYVIHSWYDYEKNTKESIDKLLKLIRKLA